MSDLRLLVVAADPLARAGLATLLSGQAGVQIVGQVDAGQMLPAEIDIYRPELIVWDLGWDPAGSLALLEELAGEQELDEIPVLALIPDEEPAGLAWSAGARGLLFRDVTAPRLLAAIQALAQDLAAVEPALMAGLMISASFDEPVPAEDLTPRELEVLQLLAEGLANRAIAQELDISEHTVKFHVNAIMGKLGAQSRTAAVVRATRLGLILL
jgi:two-component system nitrate/nitrite response regulator NarL